VITLEKNSGLILLKSKFFIYRMVSYFLFLLCPVWLQKYYSINKVYVLILMILYMGFMVGQWFLLGKEIDHRFKIYFRVNSSIDRVVYRLVLGMGVMAFYFNLLSLIPSKWALNCFWITWIILGLYYSWPNRGKIIQEGMSSNFGEFKFLDSFEKTLVFLIVILFFVSIPELPKLNNLNAVKLYFDSFDRFHVQYWNFLTTLYFPFMKHPNLLKLAIGLHFYIINMGIFLITLYAFLRFFVSRRLSLLGVFALISSWSFSKTMVFSPHNCTQGTLSLLIIWSAFFIIKSSTYRSGLFWGILIYFVSIVNAGYFLVTLALTFLLYSLFLQERTLWFRRQFLKYCTFGIGLSLIVVITKEQSFEPYNTITWEYVREIIGYIYQKAFYWLAIIGVPIFILGALFSSNSKLAFFKFNRERYYRLGLIYLLFFVSSFILDSFLVQSFGALWIICLFSLIPLEFLFQSMSRIRSKRNMIYLVYILICLLDSHFEGRIKIFLKIFDTI